MRQTRFFISLVILFLAGATLSACSLGAQPQETQPVDTQTPLETQAPPGSQDFVTGQANVESIEILILESFPVQVQVVARGNLPDGCTTIDQAQISRQDSTFMVTLTTKRPAEAACTEALAPYEHVIPLEAQGLNAGVYVVNVNGITGTFELTVDNVPVQEPTDTPTPTPLPETGSISGKIWHDLCAVSGGEGSEPAQPSEGCVEDPDGGYIANGTLEADEPGIEAIQVDLGQGQCPATGFATAMSDDEGVYSFKDLPAGTYCVSIDAQSGSNNSVLLPGSWTSPAAELAQISADLSAGEKKNGVNFGWDFQFLPETGSAADCVDKLAFVEDITVPDDTSFTSGEKFTKTWKLRNEGTCTWDTNYALVFAEGDQMGGRSPQSLSNAVPPKGTVDISVELTAPAKAGTYRSDWLLENQAGETFGAGVKADQAFWVQIAVVESVSDLGLGAPDWTDSFEREGTWFLVDSPNTRFEVEGGSLVMTGINPGGGEEWGLSVHPVVQDFYLEVTARTGDECSGLDRYGLLARAPESNAGYVFGFSCDGRYRIYQWDGENYNPLVEWRTSPHILVGPNKTNKMGFFAEGDTIKLYANGRLLVELQNSVYEEGRFGLFVGSANTSNFEVFVEQISLWELEN